MMLQRAASSAYSWWWASHIRTKQSKWLQQSLQDMDDKVQDVLKMINDDGDSFAKRAEMYYKNRPELIHFVEDSYRAFRALAERYDHLSTELQKANTTIAQVFPEQVQYAMESEDEFGSPRSIKSSPSSPSNAPTVPKAPTKELRGVVTATTVSKKLQTKKVRSRTESKDNVPISGLTKSEALEEIDKLQKEILALQTVKEFVKSSYESGLAKYWEIENQVMENQQRVCCLQDEFKIGTVIEDADARTLMVEAALTSCLETLTQLQEKQERSTEEARQEYKKIEEARKKIESLKHEFFPDQSSEEKSQEEKEDDQNDSADAVDSPWSSMHERQEMEELRDKIREHFEVDSTESFTMTELAEKIDELVTKVISLETAVSSQIALINRLRTETDDLHSLLRHMEDDRVSLLDGTQGLHNRLKEMEAKLHGVQVINRNVECQNNNLKTHFTEARCSLDHLSEKLQSVKPDEENEDADSIVEADGLETGLGTKEEAGKQGDVPNQEQANKKEKISSSANIHGGNKKAEVKSKASKEKKEVSQKLAEATTGEEEPTFIQMLLNGVEDREKILLKEYTTILKSYKDVKRKLSDEEKKNRDSLFEATRQLKELKIMLAKKDEEVQSLRHSLNLEVTNPGCTMDLKEDDRSAKPETAGPSPMSSEFSKTSGINDDIDIKLIMVDQAKATSAIEEKLRMNIDAILDENLDFWLRFSTSFYQVQKFGTEVQDLMDEIAKLREKRKQDACNKHELKSDIRPIFKHLGEAHTELTVWIEQSALLKDELHYRLSSLCNIQEDIKTALKEGVEEETIKFNSHQAAKLQGEVLNMKQENNKVREELQAGYDHVILLQLNVERTLVKLDDEFGFGGGQAYWRHSASRSKIPLRSFIFGTVRKQKHHSIFSRSHQSRKYQVLRAGVPM